MAGTALFGRSRALPSPPAADPDYLRLAFEASPIAINVLDHEGRVLKWNPAAEAMFGWRQDEVIGRPLPTVPEDEEQDFRQMVESLAYGGSIAGREVRRQHRDGRILDINLSTARIHGKSGEPIGTAGFLVDITGAQRTERALRESEERLNAFFANAPDGLAIYDSESRYIQVNEVLAAWNGIPAEDHVGQMVRDVLPDYAATAEALDRQILTTGERVVMDETTAPLPSDAEDIRFWSISRFPIPGADGNPAGVGTIVADITERKRAEQALRESEERFRSLVETMNEGLGALDTEGVITYVNDRACEMFGYSREEMIGQPVAELMLHDEENRRKFIAQMTARKSAEALSYELEGTRKDGAKVPLIVSPRNTYDGDGVLTGSFTVMTDVSALKQAEREAHEAQARVQEAIDAMSEGFLLFDADERLLLANDTYRAYFAQVEDRLVPGMKFEDWARVIAESGIVEDAIGRTDEWLAERVHDFRNPSGPKDYSYTDGRWIQIREYKTLSGGTAGLRMDITGLKRAEAEIRALNTDLERRVEARTEALRESEERLRQLAENINEVLWITSPDFQDPIYISPACETVWGGTPEEFYANPRAWFEIIHPDDQPAFAAALDRKAAGDHEDPRFPEYRVVRPDGEIRWMLARAFPVRSEDGSILRIAGIAEDITERKRLEAKLLLAERMATLGRLSATVSHELRNPLGAIRTSLSVVEIKAREAGLDIGRATARMERSIVRCDRIIEEMLDYARAGQLRTVPTAVDSWLGQVLDEQSVPDGIAVKRDLAATGAVLDIDPDRLRRAIINLCGNACDAMEEINGEARDGATLNLTVASRFDSGDVVITVADDGPGMTDELLANAFEPLFSTKSFGVGLGLPIVKQIVEQHGGRVEFQTAPGDGTRATIRLPLDGGAGDVA